MTTLARQELIDRIIRWTRTNSREIDRETIALDETTDLIASGALDSVGFIQLLAYLEDETGREIDLSDIDPTDFTTVAGLAGYALRTSTGEEAYVR